jgi:hypothetical protein
MVTSKIRLDFTEHWCHAVVEACTLATIPATVFDNRSLDG